MEFDPWKLLSDTKQDDDDEMLGRKSSHGSSSEVMMVYMCVAGDNKT